MDIHVALPNFGVGSSKESLIEIAVTAEELGYGALGVADHLLIPRGNPSRYERVFEAFTTLAYVAAVTKRIRLMPSVVVLPMRNPIIVAKEAATLDVLSDGRLVLGLGAGWNEGEFANLGASFTERGRRMDEGIDLIRHLFSGTHKPFRGRFYSYQDGVFDPVPLKGTSLPLMIGGNSDAALRRAARVAAIWQSNLGDPSEFASCVRRLRQYAGNRKVQAGIRVSMHGTVDEMRATALTWARAGAEHLMLNFGAPSDYTTRMRLFSDQVRPLLVG